MVRKKKEVSRRESLLSELASECECPEEFMDLLSDLKKSLLEKALDAEMDHHLGYRKHEAAGRGTGNSRNGKSKKTVQGEFGQTQIETPRDRMYALDINPHWSWTKRWEYIRWVHYKESRQPFYRDKRQKFAPILDSEDFQLARSGDLAFLHLI